MVQNGGYLFGNVYFKGKIKCNSLYTCNLKWRNEILAIFVFTVSSSVRKNCATRSWHCSRIKRRLSACILLVSCVFRSDLGPMGVIHIRSYSWQIKCPIRSECVAANRFERTVLPDDSSSDRNSSVRNLFLI